MERKQSSIEWFIERIEENTIGDICAFAWLVLSSLNNQIR